MLSATPHCPVAPQSPALLAVGCPLSASHAGCWSLSWCPQGIVCPPHLLALLILPQVEGPFGQGQPVLVDLGAETGAEGEQRKGGLC